MRFRQGNTGRAGNLCKSAASRRRRKSLHVAIVVFVLLVPAITFGLSGFRSRTINAPGVGVPANQTITNAIPLTLLDVIRRGRIVEIKGRTEPEASVLINGERIPLVLEDGSFTYLTVGPEGPFPVTITAQNRHGETKTIRYTAPAE